MNKTKKLTQGAMMLAIVGALILIDRMIAYMFTELIVLLIPVVIIMYSTMHSLKDGVLLSVGMAIISFILGSLNLTYLIYVPVSIATALLYSYGIRRNCDKKTLRFIAMTVYVFGELVASFIVYPLYGFPITQMMDEYKVLFNETGSWFNLDINQIFATAGLDQTRFLLIIFIISTIIMGVMEGLLIHLLSVVLLKRFKILDMGNTSLWDIKPNPVLAYVAMLFVIGFNFFTINTDGSILYNCLMVLSVLSYFILLYYGYIFIALFSAIVLRKNFVLRIICQILLILFIFRITIVLILLGFLYATGPLRSYLEFKLQQQQQMQ